MISGDVIRGVIDILVLECVWDEPSYGYAISKHIENRAEGRYSIKETTLYSAMRRLEEAGSLGSFKGASETGRPRTYYRITDSGRRFYIARCQEWLATVELVSLFIRNEELS